MSFLTRVRTLPYPITWTEPKAYDGEQELPRAVTDEVLLEQAAAQDPAALRELMNRYARLVMRIAVRILRDAGEAEEVAQEVFLYVHKKAAAFDAAKGTGRGWIVQLAYHRAYDRRAFLSRRGFYHGTDRESLADTLAGGTDLDREIGSRLSREQLLRAFEDLPERQRRTLEMFYFDGLELREIGDRIGETLENVRHHYYRGLKNLQKSAIIHRLQS